MYSAKKGANNLILKEMWKTIKLILLENGHFKGKFRENTVTIYDYWNLFKMNPTFEK